MKTLRTFVALFLLLIGLSAHGAIAFDAQATPAFSTANVATLSTAGFTISGANRILIVGVLSGAGTPVDPTTVKAGGCSGTNMTQVGSTVNVGGNVKLTMWRLTSTQGLGTGSTVVCVAWPSNQDETGIVAASYTGVDQTTPLGTPATATVTSSAAPTVNVTSATGELVVDVVGFLDSGGANRTLTVGAGQTSRGEVEGANLGSEGLGTSEEAGAATTTMSWTISAAIDAWGIIGVPLKAAGAGGGTAVPVFTHHYKDMKRR